MRRYLLALPACVLLAGCPSVAPVDIQASCLPIKTYTQAELNAFADQLAAADATKKYPALVTFLGDYEAMRAADKACQGTIKP